MTNVRQMPDDSEVEFLNLPVRIRELIIHLWETNPEICSPFGSTSDPHDLHDQIGQPSLVDQTVPDASEDQESLEAERREENQPVCENENSADNEKQYLLISSSSEENVPEDPAAPETSEQERKRKGKGVAYEVAETSADHQLTFFEGNHTPAGIDAASDNEKQNLLISSSSEENVPEDPAAPETSEQVRKRKGKGVAYEDAETSADHQLTFFEGNHSPAEIDAAPDLDYDSDRTLCDLLTEVTELKNKRRQHEENVNKATKNKNNPKKKPKFSKNQSYRVLSDLNTELNDEHLEIPFPYDFVDDITQISTSELNVEKANLENNKNKKHKARKTEESPRFDEAGPSNHGVVNCNGCIEPCGSGSVVGRVSMAKPPNRGHTKRSSRPTGSTLALGLNSDNEINDLCVKEVAGILLALGEDITQALECRGLGDCDGCEPSGSQSEVIRDSEVNGSPDEMEMEMVQAREPEREILDCTLNQNPAEFNTEDTDKFTRRI